MSYTKRALPARLVRVSDTAGDTLFPLTPAPFYRCEDRPRRIPVGHPMAAYHPSPAVLALPQRLESNAGRLAVAAIAGFMAGMAARMWL